MTTTPGWNIVAVPSIAYPGMTYGSHNYGDGTYGQKASNTLFARRYRLVAHSPTSGGPSTLADTDVIIVRGDTLPSFVAQIIGDDGGPLDLTGCQVWLNKRPMNGDRSTGTSQGCVIVAATTGVFAYDWLTTDTDIPGEYQGEVEVVYSNGRRLTVPTVGKLRMHFGDDISASTSSTFVPQRHDLSLWAGDTVSFKVSFTDSGGAPVNVSGTWAASFSSGGRIVVDDSHAATGEINVTVADTAGVSRSSQWELRRTDIDLTYVWGEVTLNG